MKRFSRKSRSGFTLVELLIVVAIIGVLSTIGVPTFKKMVQKAKKSEAKVGLGALYTVETAFYSEYGTYGNNINAVGFELDGVAATRIYTSGFPGNNCSSATVGTIAPLSGAGGVLTLSSAFPAYYTAPTYFYVGGLGSGGCLSSTMPSSGSSFTATAGGYISNTSGSSPDQWTMDNFRTLSNSQDGVK